MRQPVIVCVLAACASTAAPPSAVSNHSPPSAAELAREAERLLDASTPVDYRRPMLGTPVDHGPSNAVWVAACRAGDRRSCWIARTLLSIDSPDVADVERRLRSACVDKHVLSCRALHPAGAGKTLRGWWGITEETPAADPAPLRRACAAGFPGSCDALSKLDVSDADVAWLRTLALWREGCHAGILSECWELLTPGLAPGSVPEDSVIAARMICRLDETSCTVIASAKVDSMRQRDLFEHACQYSPIDDFCDWLAQGYKRGAYVEPVPGRGAALRAWLDAHR